MIEPHSEYTTTRPIDAKDVEISRNFTTTLEAFMRKLGGSISWDSKLLLGTYQTYLMEDDQDFVFDKEVGSFGSISILAEVRSKFDDNNGTERIKERHVYCEEYRFGPDLKVHFKTLIAVLPTDRFTRILRCDTELVVRIYDHFSKEEASNLLEQTNPVSDEVIGFTQGEWVLVDGTDTHHKVASFGRNTSGCR